LLPFFVEAAKRKTNYNNQKLLLLPRASFVIMKTLVTGAQGFVGLNIVRCLAFKGVEVVALGRRAPDEASLEFLQDVRSQITWVMGDVTDRSGIAKLVKDNHITHILHAAALTASPGEEKADPASMFDINAGGTLNVLEAARHAEVERVVFVSSTVIYGAAPPSPPKRETDPLVIDGLYSVCKQTSEHLCRLYNDRYGLSVVVGRLGSAYGPMERPTHSRQRMSAVYTAVHAALEKRPLKVHGTSIARDYCYIDDVAEAFTALLLASQLEHSIYNVGSAEAYTLTELLDIIQKLEPTFFWVETSTLEEADIALLSSSARAGLDMSRLEQDTTWTSQFTLERGIKVYLNWLRSDVHQNS
jgi:nucleoside-diphosphate-sugar epimerase